MRTYIIAYQHKSTHALVVADRTLEQQYLDGISITHGSAGSRPFSSALSDSTDYPQSAACSSHIQHLFWEIITSVIATSNHARGSFFPDDPLWDGAGCGPSNTCCTFNNSPSLPQTTDDLKVRICDRLQTHLSCVWKFTCSIVYSVYTNCLQLE